MLLIFFLCDWGGGGGGGGMGQEGVENICVCEFVCIHMNNNFRGCGVLRDRRMGGWRTSWSGWYRHCHCCYYWWSWKCHQGWS